MGGSNISSHNIVNRETKPEPLLSEIFDINPKTEKKDSNLETEKKDRRKTSRIDDKFEKIILKSEYVNTMKPVIVPRGSFSNLSIEDILYDKKNLFLYFFYDKEKGVNKNMGSISFFLFDQEPSEMLNDLSIKVNFDKIERYKKTPIYKLGEKTYYIYTLREGCKLL